MILFISIGFLLLVTGCFIILELSPFVFLESLAKYINPPKTSIKSKIKNIKKQKQPKGLKLLFIEVKEILKLTGKSNMFAILSVLSMILFVVGAFFSLSMNNIYLVPVMAIGLSLLPFYYVKFTASKYKRQIGTELETALSAITTSYLRGNNTIIRAIEENVSYLNPPIADIFESFLMESKLINMNLKEGLEQLKLKLDNTVFCEWVDGVISCQDDHNLKSTLPPIISKLSDTRVVSGELDLLLFEPIKEYITMIILLIGSIPLMYFLNKDWYETLMFTEFGKIILAICCTVIFISIGAVSKHTKPIEYKR